MEGNRRLVFFSGAGKQLFLLETGGHDSQLEHVEKWGLFVFGKARSGDRPFRASCVKAHFGAPEILAGSTT